MPGAASSFSDLALAEDPQVCARCGSQARNEKAACLQCLLRSALEPEGADDEGQSWAELLGEVKVADDTLRLRNYEVIEEIGRGGMGVIYRARQQHSRRVVALKCILNYHADSPAAIARFRREAEAASTLDHPNILPIYEVSDTEEGMPFFSMKFAPGGSLVQTREKFRGATRESVAMMAKISRAVHYAHGQGILHRDLKPGNILFDGRGEPLLSDFGLAKWLDQKTDLTRTLTIFGTPGYIAPEQARGPSHRLTAAADIYSLGAILFELLASRPPFVGEHALDVIHQAAQKPAPRLRSLSTATDRDLETICARCLEREPQMRYRTAGDLAEDLQRWLDRRPIIARPVSPPARLWRWSRRNPVLAAATAACILLGGVGLSRQIESTRLSTVVRQGELAKNSIGIIPLLDLDAVSTTSPVSQRLYHGMLAIAEKSGRLRKPKDETASLPSDYAAEARTRGVRYLLAGVTRSTPEGRRIALHLFDAAQNRFTHRLLKTLPNPSELSVSTAAMELLEGGGSPWPSDDDQRYGTRNQAARDLLDAGQQYYARETPEGYDKAALCAKKAIEEDSEAAPAYTLLARARALEAAHTVENAPQFVRESDAALRKALQLAPDSAIALRVKAGRDFQAGKFQESIDELFHVAELSLDFGRVPTMIAQVHRIQGQLHEALAWVRFGQAFQTRRADDLSYEASILLELGDDAAAANAYRRYSDLFPDMPEGLLGLGEISLLTGDGDKAQAIAARLQKEFPDHGYTKQFFAQTAFYLRDFATAAKRYEQLMTANPDGGADFNGAISFVSGFGFSSVETGLTEVGLRALYKGREIEIAALKSAPFHPAHLYALAAIEAALGNREKAIDGLQDAVSAGWTSYRWMQLDPRLDSLRADSRFREINARLIAKVEGLRNELLQQEAAKK